MNWTEEEYEAYLKKRGQKVEKSKAKRSKYNSKKTWEYGICWDSLKELNYYRDLKMLQSKGLILGFARQCQFILSEGTDRNNRCISYLADFIIFYPDKTFKIVDVKGMETEIFKQKCKLFKNKYPKLKLEIEK
ncbi:DUF1064 domain-containing protein [Clostridium luticellarii]|uniref:DUF1064 domain-containing protein n=1 Tax=Clostridium luticellarii TaxID=1691940 RepID=UPI000D028AE9|nr:DUF1064 domain-containing protein [Clostridium luticellarii]